MEKVVKKIAFPGEERGGKVKIINDVQYHLSFIIQKEEGGREA